MKIYSHSRSVATCSILLAMLFLLASTTLEAQRNREEPAAKSSLSSSTFSGFRFRSIGPAFTSGRIGDFAVNPDNHSEYYVAVASGHIWKTVNNGTTWDPVFDNYGSYSIGCVVIDPNNHYVVWAGTGENNSQRALGYGDGVYKSIDGGRSWKNMGLKTSQHIGEIIVDPANSDIVYVAAEGSVWGPGGERGLYKTTNGGKTWEAVLTISENTGVSDIVMDPRDPNVIYAAAHQRRRHVFTKIDGGPESAIYKTTDGGKTWEQLKSGLPGGDIGAIGLTISPVNPDYVYAIIEAAGESGGFFRTINRGATWQKMSSHVAGSPQYYNEIFCDPKDVDKVYSVETRTQVTVDGGRTWNGVGLNNRHVDDHALWIDPDDNRHFMIGGDGGIYETYDDGENYIFKCNLPVTQFYRVAIDNDYPFYYVYGGTQDNNSMGGPSRNTSSLGVVNDDWFVTNGGDGFWSQVDPTDPNIIYAESQHGGLVRYDKKTGESIGIQPEPRKGEYTYKWNWNAPLIISPHSHTRIYFAGNKLFRSDDRGDTWKVISDDLTRQIDRNTLPVMGKVWSVDAVAKNASTSLFGAIVALDESPVQEDLVYVGTDDGLIQVTENAGEAWRKIASFPGIPEMTYISHLLASRHDPNVVYASFDNRKRDDFKPYLLKSTDKGVTWTSISNNLPENGTVHCIAQDKEKENLLFAGTEFGIFASIDGGKEWVQLKSGLPTIPVRHIVTQDREVDLVIATFGRGFYILDDYTPLRNFTPDILKKDAAIFPVKDALMFVQKRGADSQGSTHFAAENPAYGATFTYYLKDGISTLKQERERKERELIKAGKPVPYPSWEELRAEDNEEPSYLIVTIKDMEGNVVNRLTQRAGKGISRITWNLSCQVPRPVNTQEFNPMGRGSGSRRYGGGGGGGFHVLPGTYQVSLSKNVRGETTELAGPVEFKVVPLNNSAIPVSDESRKEIVEFQKKAATLSAKVQGTLFATNEYVTRVASIRQVLFTTPDSNPDWMARATDLKKELDAVLLVFNGDRTISSRNENPPTSLMSRVWAMSSRSFNYLTQNSIDAYDIIQDEFVEVHTKVNQIRNDLEALEAELERAGIAWTPGRFPEF